MQARAGVDEEKKAEQKAAPVPDEKPKPLNQQLADWVNRHKEIAANSGLKSYPAQFLSEYEDKTSPFQLLKKAVEEKLLAVDVTGLQVVPLPGADLNAPAPTMKSLVEDFCKTQVDKLLRDIHEASLSGEPIDLKSDAWKKKFEKLQVEFNEQVLSRTDLTAQTQATLRPQQDLMAALALRAARTLPLAELNLEVKFEAKPLDELKTAFEALEKKQTDAKIAQDAIPTALKQREDEKDLKALSKLLAELADKESGHPDKDQTVSNEIVTAKAKVEEYKSRFEPLPFGPQAAVPPSRFQGDLKPSFSQVQTLMDQVRAARENWDQPMEQAFLDAQRAATQSVLAQELKQNVPPTEVLPANLKDLIARTQAVLTTQLESQFPALGTALAEVKNKPADKQLGELIKLATELEDPKAYKVQRLAELAQLSQKIDTAVSTPPTPQSTVDPDFIGNWENLQKQALRQFDGQVNQHLKRLEEAAESKKEAFVQAQSGQLTGQAAFQKDLITLAKIQLQALQDKLAELTRPAEAKVEAKVEAKEEKVEAEVKRTPEEEVRIGQVQAQIVAIQGALTQAVASDQSLAAMENKKKALNDTLNNELLHQLRTKTAEEQFRRSVENLKEQEEAQFCLRTRKMWEKSVGWPCKSDQQPYLPRGAIVPGLPGTNRALKLKGEGDMAVCTPGMTYQREGSRISIDFSEDKNGVYTISTSGKGSRDERAREAINFALANGLEKLTVIDRNIFNKQDSNGVPVIKPDVSSHQKIVFEQTRAKLKAILDKQYNFYKVPDANKLTPKDLEKYKNSYLIAETTKGGVKGLELYYVTDKGVKEKLNLSPEELQGKFKAMGLLGRLSGNVKNLEVIPGMALENGDVSRRISTFTSKQVEELNKLITDPNSGISTRDEGGQRRMFSQSPIQIDRAQTYKDIVFLEREGYINRDSKHQIQQVPTADSQLDVLLRMLAQIEPKGAIKPIKQLSEEQNLQSASQPVPPVAPPLPHEAGQLQAVEPVVPGQMEAVDQGEDGVAIHLGEEDEQKEEEEEKEMTSLSNGHGVSEDEEEAKEPAVAATLSNRTGALAADAKRVADTDSPSAPPAEDTPRFGSPRRS